MEWFCGSVEVWGKEKCLVLFLGVVGCFTTLQLDVESRLCNVSSILLI